jgi:two-component system, OmpR family, alkaline phosphatase synthesis response regulator PhoP
MNQYHVLIVDGDEDLCEIIRYNLQSEGYRVDVTYSAEEAILKTISNYTFIL